ncbi:MAG TPA: dihydrodipicolinate synthase family protein [Bacillota bacterium]|nr:dihydrodipicolinate synthase family protein [Bacillota bacterium]
MAKFRGVFPVPLTPFREADQSVDYAKLEEHVEWLIQSGAAGLVSNGSTSEFPMLCDEEARKAAKVIINKAAGRVPVIVGATAPSTWKTVEYCKIAKDVGADGILALPPYYFPLTDDEVCKHFEVMAKATDLPIMVYNNPGTSKVDIKPELVARLAEIEHVDYIKESSGQACRVHEIKALAGDKIEIFIGADNIFFDALAAGAVGVIASSGNIIVSQMSEVFRLVFEEHDLIQAREKFDVISPVCSFVDGSCQFVQVLKTALDIMGRPVGPPRYPMLPLSGENRERLAAVLKKAGVC